MSQASSSRLPTVTNDFLYHATFPDCVSTIEQAGLVPSVSGFVYMVNKPEYAVGFIRLRNGLRIGNVEPSQTHTGKPPSLDNVSQVNSAVVCTIAVSQLFEEYLVSHSEEIEPSGFFPKDLKSFRYSATINASSILSFDSYRFLPLTLESFP